MEKFISDVVLSIVDSNDVIKATKYVSPKQIIRAVRKTFKYNGRKPTDRGRNTEITLTIGRPNYLEREFIKLCTKAGEPFPVKKIQFKIYSPKKKLSNAKKGS